MKMFPGEMVAKRLAFLALVLGAVATLLSFLGPYFWGFDLFSHLHLQSALGLLAVAIALVALRQWKHLAVALLLLAPHLVCLSYYFPSRAPADPGGPEGFKVITFNVLTDNSRHQDVLRYLQAADADLILLLEVSAGWMESLRPLEASHPHFRKLPRSDNFGMAVYSRFPIRNHEVMSLSSLLPCMVTELDWNGAPLTIFGAHPIPPIGNTPTRMRNAYLAELGALAKEAGTDTSVLLLGDLNTTPWSHCFRNLVESSGLKDSGKGRGFQSSWNRFNPLFTLPIDHILHSPDLQPVERWVGPSLGSDHHPVGGTFR